MNRRERLMRTLRGETVDRPAVCFYEINGTSEDPEDPDPYNIYSHPSWRPLIDLAREKTDRIVMAGIQFKDHPQDPLAHLTQVETFTIGSSRYTHTTIQSGSRTLTERTRRDQDINTIWKEEHFLKGVDDLRAYLELPAPQAGQTPDIDLFLKIEADLGDSGILMVDTPDPLCLAADLFDMAEYTVIALTENHLFHRLLERFAALIQPQVESVACAFPGRLWRIYGPEYASPPYLPPRLFREYVVRYVTPMVEAIQKYGGFARIHCHGHLKAILDDIASTGCRALDPIEPPPQGDVSLAYVRQRVGQQMALFGNLEASDMENLPTPQFEQKIHQAITEGTQGEGRGFVLMPSSCPYGRILSPGVLENYYKMIQIIEES